MKRSNIAVPISLAAGAAGLIAFLSKRIAGRGAGLRIPEKNLIFMDNGVINYINLTPGQRLRVSLPAQADFEIAFEAEIVMPDGSFVLTPFVLDSLKTSESFTPRTKKHSIHVFLVKCSRHHLAGRTTPCRGCLDISYS